MNFFNVLTILFIGLKLTNYIDWSWWLVLAPSIISLIFTIIILTISAVIQAKSDDFLTKIRRGDYYK